MKSIPVLPLLLISAMFRPVGAAPVPPMAAADAAFQAGDFAAAQSAYAQAVAEEKTNFRATVRLGYLALLGNRLDEAEKWLGAARTLDPGSPVPMALLAEAYVRRDDFTQAVPLFHALGAAPEADQMASFAGQHPYQIIPADTVTTLKFVMTDPLPVVQIRVNGGTPINVFIDTGASTLTLDTDYAKEAGAQEFGANVGTFAGGKQASYHQGRVDAVTLGDLEVRNVPIVVMPVRPMSPIFGGLKIDGIIGTVLLYHFLATLDYPHERLVLQPRSKTDQPVPQTLSHRAISVPFWMAGDHFMVAHGTLNGGPSRLFFVDTGLAGGGFSAPEATLTAGGIKLDRSQTGQGIGGGGATAVVPFSCDTLTLGGATQNHVPGLFLGPFPFEDAFGFHLSGLISHRFFQPYALTLDFTNMRYYLQPGGAQPQTQP